LPDGISGVGNFTASQAVNVNGSFTTIGSQTYNGLVTLVGNSALHGTTLTLGSGLAGGGNNLTLDFSSPFTLPSGIIGVNNFTASQAVKVNGSFTTIGSQTYNGLVTLIGNSDLHGATLTLGSGLAGAGNDLILDFSTAFTLPGGISRVKNFTASQAVNVNGSFTTIGSQ